MIEIKKNKKSSQASEFKKSGTFLPYLIIIFAKLLFPHRFGLVHIARNTENNDVLMKLLA